VEIAQAVKTYQRSQGLKADGVLDSLTYYRIMGKSFPQPAVSSPAQEDKPGRQAESIIATAKRYIGVPYRFGGVDPKGFDCSGYVQFRSFDQHERKLTAVG